MEKTLDKIIQESVREVLAEMDLVPTDANGEANLTQKQAVNAWRMIYRLMDNVKVKMDTEWQGRNGVVSNKDVNGVIDYINKAIQNITRNTIRRR